MSLYTLYSDLFKYILQFTNHVDQYYLYYSCKKFQTFIHQKQLPTNLDLIQYGYLHLLQKRKNKIFSIEDMNHASYYGQLDCLKYLRLNGCPWDEYTFSYAAKNGHLEIIKWGRLNGCPWNELTCSFAALNGHLEVLKWSFPAIQPA